MGEQLIWNDIISMNSIGNERKQWYQLHGGIGCNWCTSSIGGRAIDLEWNFLIQFNWEWKELLMVSITWNRMQLMHFINWLGKQLIRNDIFSFNSIGNERKQQWYQLHGIWCNCWCTFLINWRSNWSEMILSQWIQLGMKGNNGINYMEE